MGLGVSGLWIGSATGACVTAALTLMRLPTSHAGVYLISGVSKRTAPAVINP